MGKRLRPQEIIAQLRKVEVRLAHGVTAAAAERAIGETGQSDHQLRKTYGVLQTGQVKRMTYYMDKANVRLRPAVSDLTLDNHILQDVVRGKF